MRFGLFLQPLHHPSRNPTEALEGDLDLVVELDRLGYSEVWVGEHHSTGWENIAAPDAFIAAAAERTSRIKLGTGVVQLGLHHPLTALDRAIFLDHLTRGRSMFGVGVGGGIPSDLTVFGLTPETAGRRMQESLEVMLQLLDGSSPVTAKTDWFELNDAVLQLRPYTDPHMPLAVASTDPRNVRLMGRLGGAVLMGGLPEKVSEVYRGLQRGAADSDRQATRDQIMLSCVLHIAENRDDAIASFRDGAIKELFEFQVEVNGRPRPEGDPEDWYRAYVEKNIIGSPQDAIDRLEEIADRSGGIGGMIFMTRDWAGRESAIESWRLFADEVAPRFARQRPTERSMAKRALLA